jgi:hypothetical protein
MLLNYYTPDDHPVQSHKWKLHSVSQHINT